MENPDFALVARAFGGFGVRAERDEEVPAALAAALRAIDEDHVFALVHLVVEQRTRAY